ncbi:TPA: HI1506-related protein [Salmonella enterica]
MPIQITARRDGFRRLGIAHSAAGRTWPDDQFTAKELAVLESDPNLIVVRVPDVPEQDTSGNIQLTAERDALQSRVSELETGNIQLNKDIESLKQQLDTANSTITAITAERDALQVKLDAAPAPVTDAGPGSDSATDKATTDETASAGKKKG